MPYFFERPTNEELNESFWWQTPVPLVVKGEYEFVVSVIVEAMTRPEEDTNRVLVRVRRAGGESDFSLPNRIFGWQNGYAFFEETSEQGEIVFVPDNSLPSVDTGLRHTLHDLQRKPR
jgi:hypothetical protein